MLLEALKDENLNVVGISRNAGKLAGELSALGIKTDLIEFDLSAPEADFINLFNEIKVRYGRINYLINNAGFGRPRSSFEKKEPPWRVLFSMNPIGVSARWEAGKLDGRYYFALAALAPYFSGGLFFEPHVSPEEGLLRFYLVPARNKIRLAARLLRGRLGRSLFDSKITKLTTNRLTIETDVPVWPQADGEPPPEKPARHLAFNVLPEKANLWVVH